MIPSHENNVAQGIYDSILAEIKDQFHKNKNYTELKSVSYILSNTFKLFAVINKTLDTFWLAHGNNKTGCILEKENCFFFI